MSKKTFNVVDLTKEVYGIHDSDSDVINSQRKKVAKHIKDVQIMLGHPITTFEAPMEHFGAYVYLIKNLLENPENDEALDLLKKKLMKGKPLKEETDGEALKSLVRIVAEANKQILEGNERERFETWLDDQLSNAYYNAREESLKEVMSIVKNDFKLFDKLSNLNSKMQFIEQYMNEMRFMSSLLRKQVEEELLFEECFLEVMKSHPHLNKKTIYTMEDFQSLPPSIQIEISQLKTQKQEEPSED